MVKNLKIKKVSAADMVCSKMKDLVVKGEWAVGDKIPSESDLAESFGVNRLTVRIALQRLNALGILETRVGDGSYVRSFDFSNHIAEISDLFAISHASSSERKDTSPETFVILPVSKL